MPFTDDEFQTVRKMLEPFITRMSSCIREYEQLDVAYNIRDQSAELYIIRPAWPGKRRTITERPIAKIIYIRKQKTWRIYNWEKERSRWVLFDAEFNLSAALEVIRKDRYECFWE